VIAAGQSVGASCKEFLDDARRDAKSRGGVLAVDDAEIDLALRKDIREPLVDDFAAGRTDDVTDEEDLQNCAFLELGDPSLTSFAQGHDPCRIVRSGPLGRALLGPEPHLTGRAPSACFKAFPNGRPPGHAQGQDNADTLGFSVGSNRLSQRHLRRRPAPRSIVAGIVDATI